MIKIELDTGAMDNTIRDMIERVGHFVYDMDSELMNWQTQDMHRQNPFTKLNLGGKSTYTVILSDYKRKMRSSGGRFSRKRFMMSTSLRPILRPELYDILDERMKALLKNCLKWTTGVESEG
jgi:hypothetical protein